MKKETKFKVWDKINRKFISDEELKKKNWNVFSHINNPDSPYIFNEYTGLKDKNGVEIYEGHIVEWKPYGGLILKSSIGFTDGTFTVGGYEIINGDEYYTRLSHLKFRDGKIVGNIYENPELIEYNTPDIQEMLNS